MTSEWNPTVKWILAVTLSPIAALYLIGLALFSVLQTFLKAILLFSIVDVVTEVIDYKAMCF